MTDHERYLAAAHAVQSGIAMLMHIDSRLVEPKHLRVGIDTCKAEAGGLATLLVKKGVFTEEEYVKAMADGLEIEKSKLEKILTDHYGSKCVLV